jgi:hypothetical protein
LRANNAEECHNRPHASSKAFSREFFKGLSLQKRFRERESTPEKEDPSVGAVSGHFLNGQLSEGEAPLFLSHPV